jgi:hypothetical protein
MLPCKRIRQDYVKVRGFRKSSKKDMDEIMSRIKDKFPKRKKYRGTEK